MQTDWFREGDLRFVQSFCWRGPDNPSAESVGEIIARRENDVRRYRSIPYIWVPFLTDVINHQWDKDYIHLYAFDAIVARWPESTIGDESKQFVQRAVEHLVDDDPYMFAAVSRLWAIGTSEALCRGMLQPSVCERPNEFLSRCLYYLRNRGYSFADCQERILQFTENEGLSDVTITKIEETYYNEFLEYPIPLIDGVIDNTIAGEDEYLVDEDGMTLSALQ